VLGKTSEEKECSSKGQDGETASSENMDKLLSQIARSYGDVMYAGEKGEYEPERKRSVPSNTASLYPGGRERRSGKGILAKFSSRGKGEKSN